jgi:3-methylcrotonyl-CoA carboxylase beta subunit
VSYRDISSEAGADPDRVDALLDPGSPFLELSPLAGHDVYPDPLPGAGLVTGIGE